MTGSFIVVALIRSSCQPIDCGIMMLVSSPVSSSSLRCVRMFSRFSVVRPRSEEYGLMYTWGVLKLGVSLWCPCTVLANDDPISLGSSVRLHISRWAHVNL